jgi:hypothetical protein
MRLIAGDANSPEAMAQVLVRRYPFGGAVCWMPGGPVGAVDVWATSLGDALQRVLEVRWLYLRINALCPFLSDSVNVLKKTGWRQPVVRFVSGLSLAYDPSLPEPERRLLASGNWRHNLKRSAKYDLAISKWTLPKIADLREIYRSMEEYKNLPEQMSDDELGALIDCLGEHIILYRCDDSEGKAIALRACALFSGVAYDLLAAASPSARKQYASHATLWALLGDCGRRGVTRYDMGGADPERNKGVYDFKRGLGAVPFNYLGEWEWTSAGWVRLLANLALRRRRPRQ